MKFFVSVLFAALLLAGCAAPVRYVQVAAAATTAPAPVETTVVVTPTVVYVEQPLFSPVIGIAAGYMLWRGLSGGRHGGHHRR